jgi:hypothetical protein
MTDRACYHIAQVNLTLLRAPLHSPLLAEFVARLESINVVADGSLDFDHLWTTSSR